MAAFVENLPPPPPPIHIRQAIDDILVLLLQVRRKLDTMINWYIYPDIVPSEIKAYDPRLLILQERLTGLGTISYQQLALMIDQSDQLGANYLFGIVEQIMHSIRGIQFIFENHYDPDIFERKPFETIWSTLIYRLEQLKLVSSQPMIKPRRLPPEDLRGANQLGNFCRGAIQMLNHRDRGKISFIEKRDLTDENQRKLRDFGGAFLNWECHECAYKVRYHVSNSMASNIHSNPAGVSGEVMIVIS